MFRNKVLLPGIALSLALAFIPAVVMAENAEALLKRASNAMGATDVKTLRYAAEGTGYTFGQAFVPSAAWPKITVHGQIRTINYDSGSMREEFTLSRAEPTGGGGYPQSGQLRNDQFVSPGYAWNVAGGNPQVRTRDVTERTHQLWITPHGVVRAAMKNNAMVQFQDKGGKSLAAVSFTEPGRFVATVYINDDYLVERVESRAPDAVLGDLPTVTTYSDYRDFGGVKFPSRIRQSQGGHPVLDVAVKEVQPNAAADIALPDAVKTFTDRVTNEKVADGVWFVAGGSHNSVAIEMKDHVVLVEAPLNDNRTGAVIDQVKQLVPGKPIRYVINSHNHFDHSGGLRAAAAEGATIVTQAANKAYFEKAFAVQNTIVPDRLAKSGKRAKFMEVKDKMSMSDGTRTLDILRITDSVHNDTFLMVYLPKEKLLIEADGYTPLAPNAQPPATPNPLNVNLIENIERQKLAVDRILPLHGRVVPVSDLYTTAKATPK
jgi:glyoxylase-like metal-dependent hydrolase (beta-lactamase superfamily II)